MSWIPCSDGMPIPHTEVIVTAISVNGAPFVMAACYDGSGWYLEEFEEDHPVASPVVAWTPLPEPYKP